MFGLFKRGHGGGENVTPQEVRDLSASGAITLVDVREEHEWRGGHIAGAVHIALSRLPSGFADLPKGKPVVLYCLSGGRSGRALDLARTTGHADLRHMAGGISAWTAQGFPVVR